MRKILGCAVFGAGLLLAACGGPQEDPRVSFCRGLAADLSGTDVAGWQHAGNRFVRPEYAVVAVRSGAREASCWYEYSAVEPGAMEQATPLLAYATLPYQVRIDGRVLKGQALSAAVRRQQAAFGQAVIEQAREGVRATVEQARQVVDQVERR